MKRSLLYAAAFAAASLQAAENTDTQGMPSILLQGNPAIQATQDAPPDAPPPDAPDNGPEAPPPGPDGGPDMGPPPGEGPDMGPPPPENGDDAGGNANEAPEVKPADANKPPEVKPGDAGKPPEVKPGDAGKPPEVKPADASKPPEVKPAVNSNPNELGKVTEPDFNKPPEPPPVPANGIVMNFQDADLNLVVDHLSRSAGYIMIKEAKISGRVTAVGLQPLSAEDALRLLDTLLAQHGYVAIRNDRILRIVTKSKAGTDEMPVRRGSDPAGIPKSEQVVIQIIPLQYLSAEKVLENLRPLVSNPEAMTANAAGNAIIIIDSQIRIRRVAEVIQALDSTVNSVTSIKVFPLQYAKADDLAKVIEKIYKTPTSGSSSGGMGGMGMFGGPFGGRGRDGGGDGGGSSNSSKASTYSVTAASDNNTNSLVVSAPEQLMKSIADMVKQLDTPTEEAVSVKVFTLQFADATKVVEVINGVYTQSGRNSSSSQSGSGRSGGGFRSLFGGGSMGGSTAGSTGGSSSSRQLLANQVSAAADTRTNSVVVSASKTILAEIDVMIKQLDNGPGKSERMYVHKVRYADLDRLQAAMEALFEAPTGSTGSRNSTRSTTSTRNTGNTSTNNSSNNSSARSSGSSSGSNSFSSGR
jgi:type II secretory pathway component GspD/PulD (secretin)